MSANAVTFDVTIGWTMSDLENGYSSFDGYLPGAKQHREIIQIEWSNPPVGAAAIQRTVESIAEAAFFATNAPRLTIPDGILGQVCRAMDEIFRTKVDGDTPWPGTHWALSVGDTVTVNEATLACAKLGWERVYLHPPV